MRPVRSFIAATLVTLAAALPWREASANPVSFKDGWGIMPVYGGDWSDLQVNYSYTSRDAAGLSAFYRDGEEHEATFVTAQYNRLLRRWNELESQANLYASAGGGARFGDGGDAAPAALLALEGNYETRRIYTTLALETLQSPGSVDFSQARYRAGVSPWLAPIDELQTWVVAQVVYMSGMEDEVTITPLLRFFYNNYALELGSSIEGEPFVAAMAHF